MTNLSNKVAVLIGAVDALGQAVCRRLRGLGCRIGVLASASEGALSPSDGHPPLASEMVVRAVDVRDRMAVRAAVDELSQTLGPVDVLLHRAPVYEPTAGTTLAIDSLRAMLEANCLGGIYAVEAGLPGMLARGRGHIVELSSLAALRGTPGTAAYAATTRAFATYLESLRPPLRRRGVLVTMAFVGFVPDRTAHSALDAEAAAAWVERLIRRGRREGFYPWRFALAARFLRRLPAWTYDAWAPRLERFLAGASFR